MSLTRVVAVATLMPLVTIGAQESPSKSATGRIVGHVEHPTSGRDLAGAKVTLTRSGDVAFVRTVATDAKGNFVLSNLEAGQYRVSALHPSFDSTANVRSASAVRLLRGRKENVELGRQLRGQLATDACGENPLTHPAALEVSGPERAVGNGAARLVALRPGEQGNRTQYALVDGCRPAPLSERAGPPLR